ncbi:unnamed protein product [Urochloa decumbens]|uniref:MATH domain-containing protein n=1 Tax=Urochloa decumbens TaxID=240449 RepID=A0ABC9D0Z1_9POAL
MSPDVASLPLPSASIISATATSGVHVVKLSGYSHAKRLLGTGEFVQSAMFRAAGQFWRVKVYPNGSRDKCGPSSIAPFLSLVGGNVRAKFRFSLVRHGGKLASAPDGGRAAAKAPVTFNADERDWGFENHGLGGKLEDPEYLKDDAILIRCDITVLAVEQHNLDALDLLCDCDNDGLCEKLHAHDDKNTKKKKKKKASQKRAFRVDHRRDGERRVPPLFWEAGHMWRIRCYPDGDREETAGHVSLYLELAGEYSTNVHAEFQFSLVPHGHLTAAPRGGGTRRGRWTFGNKYVGNSCGFKDFMAREKLEKSEYLKDDCFCVRCDVTAMNKPVAKLRDPEKLELLCHCNVEICKSIHGPRKMEAPKAETLGKPRRFLGLKKMLLSCIPIRAKTSQQQQPVFDVEYSRL